MQKTLIPLLIITILSFSCSERNDKPAGKDGWLKGDKHEKLDTIAKQLRGFDMAMVETDYRYQELYWAGHDKNWDYAFYQLSKIRTAIESGLQRRPKRALSAQHFLNNTLLDMESIIVSKDSTLFVWGFEQLTNECNLCHVLEKVPHFSVKIPLTRQSSIRK